MKSILEYTVDLSFRNCPRVRVRLLDDKGGPPIVLTLADDDARQVCEMVPNPEGEGTIATGKLSLEALSKAAAAKLEAPIPLAEQIKIREALDAEIAAKRAELAKLNAAAKG